jgi:hypothetical protein
MTVVFILRLPTAVNIFWCSDMKRTDLHDIHMHYKRTSCGNGPTRCNLQLHRDLHAPTLGSTRGPRTI